MGLVQAPTARDIRYLLRDAACRHWPTFRVLATLRPSRYSNRALDRSTRLVIEGFPRSANTFAVAAFAVAQGQPLDALHIARHSHAPAQIAQAVRRKLPTILLVRQPVDAVVSLAQREHVSVGVALRSYIAFHTAVSPHAEHMVIALFEQVTRDFGSVIRRLNARFATRHREFIPDPANTATAMRLVEDLERQDAGGIVLESSVARPSRQRDEEKPRLRNALDSDAFKPLVEQADALYRQFAALAK